ncbi:AAA family ATPase [Gracilinema caldarium]|uniref:Nuclease SbcCD, C subunit, putative n=1 Tax=Gracilinema caldarium (strain ATCC 51460 / DSM 7334 / H1) TaxID=744872 RepID=F8F404_GRAC1|nr:AAA family ATPase [Gracilinema caldarium]AEJ20023.1 nuclease SbcCD, C subunit, putative [Gracilinema caldarium DSM 7334]
MRPCKLRMLNIGPFAGLTEIDFTQLDDIFLISGKTGSGKTTIFDAICFALYGKLPGNRKNLETKIRSDFAGLDEDCWVELEFSLGNRIYLVQRSPKMERLKKRGTGTTTEEENAVLYRITESGEKQSLSARKSEADEKIIQLLGLSAEEFAKIVLLPQGEFAQFLQQNSQARREVLRKLFPVDEAAAIRELAMDKKKEAEVQLKTARQALEEASSRYNEAAYERETQQIQKTLTELDQKDRELVDRIKTLSEQLSRAQQTADLHKRLEAIVQEKLLLESKKPEIDRIIKALERNLRAKPAQELVFQERELEQQGKHLKEEAEQAKTQVETAINQYEALERKKTEIEALTQEAAGLREQKGALTQATEEEQRLMQFTNRLVGLRSEITAAEQTLPALRNEITQLMVRRDTCEQASGEERALQEQKSLSLAVMEQLRNLLQVAQSWGQKKPEVEKAREALQDLETELSRIESRLPSLASELSQKEELKKRRDQEIIAARLAATLHEGDPCPVCGSSHHPLPARAPAPLDYLDIELETLKREQQTLQDRRTEVRTELRNKGLNIEIQARDLEVLAKRYQELCTTLQTLLTQHQHQPFMVRSTANIQSIPTVAEVQEDIRNNSTIAESIERALQQARKESIALPQINRSLQEKQQQEVSLSTKLEQNRKQETELIHQIDELKGRLQQFLDKWKTDTIGLALNRLTSRLETIDKDLAAYEQRKQQLYIARAQALQRQEETAKRWHAYEEALLRNQQALAAKAEQLSFASPEDLKQALLTPEQEADYTATERAWNDAYMRLQHQEEETRRTLEQLRREGATDRAGNTVEHLKTQLSDIEQERQQIDATRQMLQGKYHILEQDRQRYQEALEKFNSLNKTWDAYRALADDLSGNNPKRWPFDSWLLSLYLQEVTAYANRRLERMSEGRYSIILNPEGDSSRAMAGLDLAVFDAYTGKTRPCATLSGGETFMASISLALGLADSIQSRSGAVRLDAVFIDEGFGSLDEVSLDRALTILDEIRDHRMVGLISHVGEMKNRIPSKIEVQKTNQGSQILNFYCS